MDGGQSLVTSFSLDTQKTLEAVPASLSLPSAVNPCPSGLRSQSPPCTLSPDFVSSHDSFINFLFNCNQGQGLATLGVEEIQAAEEMMVWVSGSEIPIKLSKLPSVDYDWFVLLLLFDA